MQWNLATVLSILFYGILKMIGHFSFDDIWAKTTPKPHHNFWQHQRSICCCFISKKSKFLFLSWHDCAIIHVIAAPFFFWNSNKQQQYNSKLHNQHSITSTTNNSTNLTTISQCFTLAHLHLWSFRTQYKQVCCGLCDCVFVVLYLLVCCFVDAQIQTGWNVILAIVICFQISKFGKKRLKNMRWGFVLL